ncbi:hypothetical protein AB0J30_31470, partial [Streptomyces microflavus]|uniref:hypothetical protein n=1 Tax=Streptomyces microflavus TaxID=1919 RepID=UPI003417E22E
AVMPMTNEEVDIDALVTAARDGALPGLAVALEPVTPRTPPPINSQLKPRLATALFRRYLRACIPTGPDSGSPLAGARPEAVLAESQRVGQRRRP